MRKGRCYFERVMLWDSSSLSAMNPAAIVTMAVCSVLSFVLKSDIWGILHEYPQEAIQPYPSLSSVIGRP